MTVISLTQSPGTRQAVIEFHGTPLMTAEVNGTVYASLKPIVEGMGMGWAAQFMKIKSSQRYSVIDIPLETPGGPQKMVCIPLAKLNGWLFSVNPAKVRADIREKVVLYQEECFAALYDYWHKGQAVNPRAEIMEAYVRGNLEGTVRNSSRDREMLEMKDRVIALQDQVILLQGQQLSGRTSGAKRVPVSPQEREFIARMAAKGWTAATIARKLGRSASSVRTHMHRKDKVTRLPL